MAFMSDSDPQIQTVDCTRIQFPSDKVTVADLRRIHPKRFHEDGLRFYDIDDDESFKLDLMMFIEQKLARNAFARMRNPSRELNSKDGIDPDDLDELNECYVAYGISQGIHHTGQLVRNIELQAEHQAGIQL